MLRKCRPCLKLPTNKDFLKQEKLRQEKEDLAKKKVVPRERYLTVMDIANELESSETRELDALKDRSIFVGAEEK